MKRAGNILLALVVAGIVAVIAVDRYYVSGFKKEFRELEKQRIVTSNKLATAKIVHENLHHVRDLVLQNMDFPGHQDSITHETHFFDFVTRCINDLKLKLVKVEPAEPKKSGRITTYGYDMEIEGDFFKYGELCAKFENSRRIVSVETFKVELIKDRQGRSSASAGNMGVRVTMRANTYRVSKAPPPVQPVAKEG
jgi:hypothetical protein